jgi:hypothetical protein
MTDTGDQAASPSAVTARADGPADGARIVELETRVAALHAAPATATIDPSNE